MISLSQLAIYPIKSTAQISLSSSQVTAFGLNMDRRWMLVNDKGFMLTQRVMPQMCLIESKIKNHQLIVNAPNMPALSLPATPHNNDMLAVTVWKDTCRAYDYGDKAAEWFSDFLKSSARLTYFPDEEKRQIDEAYANKGEITAFSDGFPYLLISLASLDDLNSHLDIAVDMRRFRPNLVVAGTQPFAEDQWKKIRIGRVVFRVVKPCSRCPIPTIDPDTSKKSPEVINALAAYRKQNNKVYFGQNLIAEGTGQLSVGDSVEVLE